jgi:hypothetical protein
VRQTKLVSRKKQAEPRIKAVLMESTIVCEYSDALRYRTQLPVFDVLTMVDFLHQSTSPNPRFGSTDSRFSWVDQGGEPDMDLLAARWRYLDPTKLPVVGILRIDYSYPPAPGDVDHPNSYFYKTVKETAKGLTFKAVQAAQPLTKEQREGMERGIKNLEAIGVSGITGDCGFLIAKVPCFVSSMLQCPLLLAFYSNSEEFLVLTANGESLRPALSSMLCLSGIDPSVHGRFHVVGCENVPGFDAVAKGEAVDVERVKPGVVDLVLNEIDQRPQVRAIMLECTELPPYADALRCATNMPVLDAITMVDYFHTAVSDNPFVGMNFHAVEMNYQSAQQTLPDDRDPGLNNPDLISSAQSKTTRFSRVPTSQFI